MWLLREDRSSWVQPSVGLQEMCMPEDFQKDRIRVLFSLYGLWCTRNHPVTYSVSTNVTDSSIFVSQLQARVKTLRTSPTGFTFVPLTFPKINLFCSLRFLNHHCTSFIRTHPASFPLIRKYFITDRAGRQDNASNELLKGIPPFGSQDSKFF